VNSKNQSVSIQFLYSFHCIGPDSGDSGDSGDVGALVGEAELNGPCSDYKPGEDDLQAFDFIRQFRLDVLETKYPGVTRVRGSSRLQTAYRLEKEADLVVPTRCNIFPFLIFTHQLTIDEFQTE